MVVKNKKVIITGSTGMVGKGALLACLDAAEISEVLIINRSSVGIEHPKLKEVLRKDFANITPIKDQLAGYDACFYCMGISASSVDAETYHHITYNMTKAFMDTLHELNPHMLFAYVSGAGTDSSEKGRMRWARVKGKVENELLAKGFGDAYALRPGGIIPENGIRSRTGLYNFFLTIMRPFFPLLKRMDAITTTTLLGEAMINLLFFPQETKVIEAKELKQLGELNR